MLRRCERLPALLLHLLVLAFTAAASRPAAGTGAAGGGPGSAGAPDGVPSEPCLEEVLPCTAYLKTSKHPSQTCCTAMHNAAAAEMPCLCRLFANPELLTTFNVTRDQMFKLPARCGLPVGCRVGASQNHDPVVEAPPPPAGAHQHHHSGAPSRSSEFWSVVASLVVPMAAVF